MSFSNPDTVHTARRRGRPRRQVWLLGLAAVIAICSAYVPAPAAALPRLKLPPIRKLPPVHLPPITIPEEAPSALKYGARDLPAVDLLDEANAAMVSDVDEITQRVTANTEARKWIKRCGGRALSSAGESYKGQVEEAAAAGETLLAPPDFDEVSAAVVGCLEEDFPDDSLDVIKMLADTFVNEAAAHAEDANAADPSAAVLGEWLSESGTELSTSADTDDSVPPPSSVPVGGGDGDDDSSFPWWAVLVGLGVLGVAAYAVTTARSKR
jgi:hypothetical protein